MEFVLDLLVAAHLLEHAQGYHGRRGRGGRQAVLYEDGAAGDGLGAHFWHVHGVGGAAFIGVRGGLFGDDVGQVNGDVGAGDRVVGVRWVLLRLGDGGSGRSGRRRRRRHGGVG